MTGLFTLIPFSILSNFSKVTQKKVATFSLLLIFGNYIRNPIKILANYHFLVRVFFSIKVKPDVISTTLASLLLQNCSRTYSVPYTS